MLTMEVKVLPAVLMLQEYGQATTGIKPTAVSYQIIRKGRPFGPQSANFPVNFEVPIPWVPWPPIDWPDPVHPALPAGEVKNFDESRTNELTRDDKGHDAKFTFPWFATAQNDDVVDVFWNGLRVVEAQVIFDDTTHVPGEDHIADIPWKYIKAGNNGDAIPVHYQVYRPGVENDLHSEAIEVDVDAVAVELPPASFPKIPNPTGYPGCQSLEPDGSLKVRIQVQVRPQPIREYSQGARSIRQLKASIKLSLRHLSAIPSQAFLCRAPRPGIQDLVRPAAG
jgi:hypothetical protein